MRLSHVAPRQRDQVAHRAVQAVEVVEHVDLGINPNISLYWGVTFEKQLLNIIGNLV